jgi:hypothetical protein
MHMTTSRNKTKIGGTIDIGIKETDRTRISAGLSHLQLHEKTAWMLRSLLEG